VTLLLKFSVKEAYLVNVTRAGNGHAVRVSARQYLSCKIGSRNPRRSYGSPATRPARSDRDGRRSLVLN
jgi:phage baseplate assembly protein W